MKLVVITFAFLLSHIVQSLLKVTSQLLKLFGLLRVHQLTVVRDLLTSNSRFVLLVAFFRTI